MIGRRLAPFSVELYSTFERLMGNLTGRMLTKRLRELEADGFVTRKVYPVVPPRKPHEDPRRDVNGRFHRPPAQRSATHRAQLCADVITRAVIGRLAGRAHR